jgi:hypothetical protein
VRRPRGGHVQPADQWVGPPDDFLTYQRPNDHRFWSARFPSQSPLGFQDGWLRRHCPRTLGFLRRSSGVQKCGGWQRALERPRPPLCLVRCGAASVRLFLVRLRPRSAELLFTERPHGIKSPSVRGPRT